MIPIEGYAFLDAIAVGENYDPTDYNELVGGGKFEGYDAFPEWEGRRFPTGMSHAAGRYQFQPATWRAMAEKLGLADFTPTSQDEAAWALAQEDYHRLTGRGLLSDLRRREFAFIYRLVRTWASIQRYATAERYRGALCARRMHDLAKPEAASEYPDWAKAQIAELIAAGDPST